MDEDFRNRMFAAKFMYMGITQALEDSLDYPAVNEVVGALAVDPLLTAAGEPDPAWVKARAEFLDYWTELQTLQARIDVETLPDVKDAMEDVLSSRLEDMTSELLDGVDRMYEAVIIWKKNLRAKAQLDKAAEAQRLLQAVADQTRQETMAPQPSSEEEF